MALVLKRIRGPDAIYDIQTIVHGGVRRFIASFGREVRIFEPSGEEVTVIPVPTFVYAIIPSGGSLLFLCADRYFPYVDGSLGTPHRLGRTFSTIRKVLQLDKYLMIIHEDGYITATLSNNRILFSELPNDSTFYKIVTGAVVAPLCSVLNAGSARNSTGCPWGSEQAGAHSSLYLLGESATRSVLFHYTAGDSCLVQTRSELLSYNYIFSYKGRLYALDDSGLREAKPGSPLLREVGNNLISTSFSDEEEGKILLFCQNGEVIEVAGETFEARTVLRLHGSIGVVAKIGRYYLAGSEHSSYFIAEDYTIIRTIACMGNVHRPFLIDNTPLYFTGNRLVRIETQIQVQELGAAVPAHADGGAPLPPRTLTNGISLQSMFKTAMHDILVYNNFSLINGNVFDVISSVAEIRGRTVFTTASALYLLSGDHVKRIKVPSSIARYREGFAYVYHYDKLYIINLDNFKSQELGVSLGVCDILFEDETVYLALVGATLNAPNIRNAVPVALTVENIGWDDLYASDVKYTVKPSGKYAQVILRHVSFLKHCRYCITTRNSPFTSTGGCVYKLINAALSPVFNAHSHILSLVEYGNGLIVACMHNTYYFDLNSGKATALSVNALPVLGPAVQDGANVRDAAENMTISSKRVKISDSTKVSGLEVTGSPEHGEMSEANSVGGSSDIILLHNNRLMTIAALTPSYVCTAQHTDSQGYGCLIYADSSCHVRVRQAGPRPSFSLLLDGNAALHYRNYVFVDSAVIDRGLLAVVMCDTLLLNNKLTILRIRGQKLTVRRSIKLDDVPLALACRSNTIAVVMPRQVLIFVMENGRVRLAKDVRAACNYTYNATFASRSILLTQGKDWSYNVINTQTGDVQHHVKEGISTPFLLAQAEGWIRGNKLYWMNTVADLGERVAGVFSLQEGVLVIMRSGAFVLVCNDSSNDAAQDACAGSFPGWLSLDREARRGPASTATGV